jgi:hypothetical protein
MTGSWRNFRATGIEYQLDLPNREQWEAEFGRFACGEDGREKARGFDNA